MTVVRYDAGMNRLAALGAALVCVTTIVAPRAARACAPAPAVGDIVRMADEEALIVWDAARRMQHFVRRAAFHTDADDFGFLVPTPARPELAEADDGVFQRLHSAIQPETVYASTPVFHTCCTAGCAGLLLSRGAQVDTGVVSAAPDVIVHEQTRVAGLDAAVLEARNVEALSAWLTEHGYSMRPALERWVAPYVQRGWFVTAFKIARGGDATAPTPTFGTRALRMSFATERPYYPYREPDDVDESARALRVYLVAGERMRGALEPSAPWDPSVPYARARTDLRTLLAGTAPEPPQSGWLTVFNDVHVERPDADLFFAPAGVSAEVVPPPIVIEDEYILPIPLEPVLAAGGIVWLVRRRRRSAPSQRS